MKKIEEKIQEFKKFLSTPITTSSKRIGKAGKFLLFQLKMWTYCMRLLRKNRAGQQAAALSYHTLFGLVPLMIVMLLIFRLFPAYSETGTNIKNKVYEYLNLSQIAVSAEDPNDHTLDPNNVTFATDNLEDPNDPNYYNIAAATDANELAPTINNVNISGEINLTDNIDVLVNKFFEGNSEVSLLSGALVIWAALALLSTIEKAFNNIYHIKKMRSKLQRTINYWALLTLGPLLIGVAIFVSAKFTLLRSFQDKLALSVTPAIFSYLMAVFVFFLLYFILPNTKVKPKSALWGAAIGALVWMTAKGMFGFYITNYKPYATVWGFMAIIPITVLWIYISWIIVLFGLQLTYTTQHIKTLDAAETAASKKQEDYFIASKYVTFNIVQAIAKAFNENQGALELEKISSQLNIPYEFCEKILNHLVAKEILAKSSEAKVGYLPAKEPENIKLSEIADAIDEISLHVSAHQQSPLIAQINLAEAQALKKYNIKQTLANFDTQTQ